MDISVDQPIAALASAAGGAARGIIRISGLGVTNILAEWFVADDPDRLNLATRAESHAGKLSFQWDGRDLVIPVQVLRWPNRRSYTGQHLIELHLPGSPPLLELVLNEVYRRGARPARPGEFTLRAFLAGKLDLLQAEAVLGVIDAQDHTELQTALAQLAGGVSGRLAEIRRDLLDLLADLEAGLDFVEEDIEFVSRREIVKRLGTARAHASELLKQSTDRMQSRTRPRVMLAGLPNAGKSTLFNELAGTKSALVSAEEGTTRDFLVHPIDWNDLGFDLIDTAGWDQQTSGIDAVAQLQRAAQLKQADVILWCSAKGLEGSQRFEDQRLFEQVQAQNPSVIRLLTKSDLSIGENETPATGNQSPPSIPISVQNHQGLAELETRLRQVLCSELNRGGQWLGMTAARCRESLGSATEALDRAEQAAKMDEIGDELIAIDLRQSLDHLGVILGVIYTDDVLDLVFSKFCIGK